MPSAAVLEGTDMSLEIEVLQPFGARLRGIDLGDALGDSDFAALRAALLEHGLLVVPGAPLSMAEQVALGRRFGEVETHDFEMAEHHHSVIVLSNVGADGKLLSRESTAMKTLEINERWHTDGSFGETPASVSILSARSVPAEGGDTFYASLRRAWLSLDEEERAELQGLRAVHDYADSYRKAAQETPAMVSAPMVHIRHPLVRVHPDTGESTLYLSEHASGVEGMEASAGRALLDRLLAWSTREGEVYRHRWRVDDLLLWDNRCMLHRAQGFDPRHPRVMHHVRVAGDAPVPAP